ncbi:MAG: FHA domain-containing protein [Coriobacteriia bacterium]|nr:FHA domain-containing protein [Coriobacteriia bacterium]MBN2840137.1 FHA domain-containing protein [Coriobacteriia bacterium]
MDQCPECGAEVTSHDAECPACGARVEGATASFEAVSEPSAPAYVTDVGVSDVPVLIVRKGVEVGERFYLEQSEVTIGRDPESDIFLNDVTVSRTHARLSIDGGTVTIKDTGSLNGTYVNNEVVDEARLTSGDSVQVGRFQMVFVTGGGPS